MEAISQLITLLGVVIGALTAYAISLISDRSRWRKEEKIRWDKERLTAYLAFTNSVKALAIVCGRLASEAGMAVRATPISKEEGLPILDKAELDRSVRFEGVLFLGDENTIVAAQVLNEKIWRLMDAVTGYTELNDDLWLQYFQDYRKAREEFYKQARNNMNVPHAETPLGSWASPLSAPTNYRYGETLTPSVLPDQ